MDIFQASTTYSRLRQLCVAVKVGNTQQGDFSSDINEILKRRNLHVLRHDAEGDNLVASLDTRPGDKVAREEGDHAQRVRRGTVISLVRSLLFLLRLVKAAGGSQSPRSFKRAVSRWAQRVSGVARDAHWKA
jgi:hypothetical protein